MPVYEYRCRDCGGKLTVEHGMSDPPPARCSLCGATTLTRLVPRVALVRSAQDRVRDLSWVDRGLAHRIRKKLSGAVNRPLGDTLDYLESH
jgi:putative FmdB family regulatory protein